MSAMVRMLWFHTRLFARNTYFAQLMVTSTLSILALQLLAAHANHAGPGAPLWLRAGMVGTWSVATVASGLIGFQRFQGTLAHLVFTPAPVARVMVPLVSAAATFGLASFPLAAAASALFGYPPVSASWPAIAVGIVVFWLACLSISMVIAAIFVLTPNAITYEGLLAIPLVLVSGVFGLPTSLPAPLIWLTYLLPTTPATRLLLDTRPTLGGGALLVGACLVACAAWFALARWTLGRALRRARVAGTLEVV